MRLNDVTLRVRDLGRSTAFYREAIGLELLGTDGDGSATLGFGDAASLNLLSGAGAAPRDPGRAGLFHVAWLLAGRAQLGAAIRRLDAHGVKLTGAADHGVSEAVYLDDPDGNGIELYADRPSETWRRDGELVLINDRLDLADLVEASRRQVSGGRSAIGPEASGAGARLGHVHLEAIDLAGFGRFAEAALGLEMQAAWPHARFLGWHGYHHHLAWNDWQGRRLGLDAAAEPELGLVEVGLAGFGTPGDRLVDPNGIGFVVRG